MAPDEPADRHRATAAALLPLLGGAGNVLSVTNCMTRLRLELRDRALVRDAELRALPGVLGVVEDGSSYQVVLGPGTVARVAPELARLAATVPGPGEEPTPGTTAPVTAAALAERGAALRTARKARNATPVKLLLRRIAAVFVPLIPALIGCGIVAGLAGLLANLGWLPALAPGLAAVASGFMSLIAVFVGYNAAKEFGGTPVLGGAVAAIVVYPGVDRVHVLGERLSPGQGGVLGALAAAVLAAYVERWCRSRVPEALDVLVTPTLTVLLAGFVTLYGLMFVAGEVSTAIGHLADRLLGEGGAAAGFVLGGLFLPLVMLGLHQALIPIHTTLIQQQSHTVLLPILAMAGAGQVGAALAVYARLPRNGSVRGTIRSALPAGLLGIGEPLIYGVSLPLGRPFVTACVGGAFGGGFVGLLNQWGHVVGSTAIGPSGWALFPLLKGSHGLGPAAAVYGTGLLVGYAAGFAVTYFFGFGKGRVAELNAPKAAPPSQGVPPSAYSVQEN
ncbi:PTS transporter subunit EIIC [Streptomyces albireticuli]|uniref:PTS alpha-glucoside transporter subunit IIA n=1 Tax=Streptomyces albireticuli TaxID=1940 RepID=A0A2A2CZZ1_9ACTN|nr:PTS transporter subunit EIIC [Streptomyces albireticuli]MCD9142979.1 PTS transporter subunit EIIC [Streptomyces albireticuli]MCD9165222.1 PTS transporter subunit EIIC [Streptomyces albireticuli]MCD9192262.1 PTS transporter subunit EIIC [Streptomyces albireticuli]PAU45778.1 PTS alpha-glucoside transporter subunit IIA [Streptomyces albireticuli]